MASRPAKGRIRELDFVRGIAILLVMGFHFIQMDKPLIPGYEWFFGHYGLHGVDLFFVLSGFLVGGLLIQEIAAGRPRIGHFIIRRAFKIWPLYYVFLVAAVIAHRHPLNTFLLANSLHIQNYLGTSLGHTWSLAVEEHFYLLLPGFLLLTWNKEAPVKRIVWVTIAVNLMVLLTRFVTVYVWHDPGVGFYTHTRIDALLFGVMISAIYHLDHDAFLRLSNRTWLLISMIFVAVAVKAFAKIDFLDTLGITFLYFGAAAVLLLVYSHSSRFANSRWYKAIAWIGLYSYGIFLWHNAVQAPISRIMGSMPGPGGWLAREAARYIFGIAIGVIASRVVEWPFLKLRERLFPRTERAVGPPETHLVSSS